MYRFFLNKDQLVEAVTTRLRASLEKDWSEQMTSRLTLPDPGTFIAWYTEAFRLLVAKHPVFPVVVLHLSQHCQPLEQLAMQPLDEFLSARVPEMHVTRRAIACSLMLAITIDALQMSEKMRTVPQKRIWEGLRDALLHLLHGYIAEDLSSKLP